MGQRYARRGLRGRAGRQAQGAPSGGTRLQKEGAAPLSKGGAQTAGFAALPHGLPENEAQGLPLPGLCGALCRAAGEFGRAVFFPFRRVFSRRIVPPRRLPGGTRVPHVLTSRLRGARLGMGRTRMCGIIAG